MPHAPGDEHAPVAIGAQRLALVEVHDRRLGARAAEARRRASANSPSCAFQ